jgi:uncharacterized protein
MPIIVTEIKTSLDTKKEDIISIAVKSLDLNLNMIKFIDIYKTSLDARKQNDIHFVNSVYIELKETSLEKSICEKNNKILYMENYKYTPIISTEKHDGDIVIVGFGPAGIFCALSLVENGYKPIIIERGEDIDSRVKSVNDFWEKAILNIESNVQFGEGGAGTFSDGKLTTRIKDPLCRYVLDKFIQFGAPKEILTKAKPHIGTDKLRNIVKNIRNYIIDKGAQVHFNTCCSDLEFEFSNIKKVITKNEKFNSSAVIMATGHSSRDTFEMLHEKNVHLESKPFSIGVRIEHSQKDVDYSLYGKNIDNPLLPKGEYQLSYRDREERAVYTFCMCPGGYVVPSSSEKNTIVTNGMSEFARDGENANSAMVVSVSSKDFGLNPLDGVYFAREIEKKAFNSAGCNYKAPAASVGNFINNKKGISSKLTPTYSIGVVESNFEDIFPSKINEMLKLGLKVFSRKMNCFSSVDAIMTAPETRTSSPVKILRNSEMKSVSVDNLYPCGEGSGYAGGIMSAAVDGLKVALKIMENYAP